MKATGTSPAPKVTPFASAEALAAATTAERSGFVVVPSGILVIESPDKLPMSTMIAGVKLIWPRVASCQNWATLHRPPVSENMSMSV